MSNKTLYRSRENRILAGVAGGLSEYFEVDATIIRLIFVVATLWGGAGLIIYIILWIVMPEKASGEPAKPEKTGDKIHQKVESMAKEAKTSIDKHSNKLRRDQIFGLILVAIGILFLLQNFVPMFSFSRLWPLLLILIGLLFIAQASQKGK